MQVNKEIQIPKLNLKLKEGLHNLFINTLINPSEEVLSIELAQKRMNTVSLRLLSLERLACKVSSRLATGFWDVFHNFHSDKGGTLCLSCLSEQNNLWWTPAFFLGVWNFGICWSRKCLWTDSNKNRELLGSYETTFHISGNNSFWSK